MFITIEDLYSKIRKHDLEQITGGDEIIAEHAISSAVAEIMGYLERYDTDRIFSAKGEDREGLLVSFAVDIAVYEIVAIARPNTDLTDRRERRNRAIDYLKQVRDDNISTPWPLKEGDGDEDPEAYSVAFGSYPKRRNSLLQ